MRKADRTYRERSKLASCTANSVPLQRRLPALRRLVRADREDFLDPGPNPNKYWDDLWAWFDAGGDRDVAAYLATLDISGFNPKAPPPKTTAFWAIVDANKAPEESELADALGKVAALNGDVLPNVVTLFKVAQNVT